MNSSNGLPLKVEILEKEVWHLARVEIPALKSKLEQIDLEKFEEISSSVEAMQKALSDLENQTEGVLSSLENLAGIVDGQGDSLKTLEGKVSDLSDNYDALQADFTSVQTSVEEINKSVQTLENSLSNLAYRVSSAEASVENIPKMQEDISSITNDVASLSASVQGILTDVEKINAAIKTNADDIDTLENSLGNLEYRVSSTEASIDKIPKIEQNVSTLTDGLSSLTTDFQGVKSTIGDLQTSIKQNADDIDTLENSLGNLEYRVSSTEASVEQIPSIKKDVTDLSDSLTTLQTDVAANNSSISELSSSIAKNAEDIETNANSLSNLEYRVSSAEASVEKIGGIETDVKNLKGEISPLQEGVSTLTAQTDELSKNLSTLENSHSNLAYRVSSAEAAIDKKYEKPSAGIPKTDLAESVQTSLNKADSAVQPSALNNYIPTSQKGAKSGVATLGSDGKVPSDQLPDLSGDYETLENSLSNLEYRVSSAEAGVTKAQSTADGKVSKAGDTMTGALNLNNATITIKNQNGTNVASINPSGYVTGTWLSTTSATDLNSKPEKIAVIGTTGSAKNYIYYRTPSEILGDIGGGTYSKPSGGIPKTDLAESVQTSLGKADSAVQSSALNNYIPTSQKGAKSGVATLGSDGKVPSNQLPDAIEDVAALENSLSNLEYRVSSTEAGVTKAQSTADGKVSKAGDTMTGNITVPGLLFKGDSVVYNAVAHPHGNLGWSSDAVGKAAFVALDTLAYWNGRYNSSTSNLQYCKSGEIANKAEVNSLVARVAALEEKAATFEAQLTPTVLFDQNSEDAHLNMNLKSTGIYLNKSIMARFSEYSRLRFYVRAQLAKSVAVYEFPVGANNLKYTIPYVLSSKQMAWITLTLTSDLTTLTYSDNGFFTVTAENGKTASITWAQGSSTTHGKIEKIEGLK